jgi:hypothetical protein
MMEEEKEEKEEKSYEFAKGPTEVVRAGISEFGGKLRADIRVYYQNENEEWRPTKKGINLEVDQLDELAKAVEFLKKEAEERGPIEESIE